MMESGGKGGWLEFLLYVPEPSQIETHICDVCIMYKSKHQKT